MRAFLKNTSHENITYKQGLSGQYVQQSLQTKTIYMKQTAFTRKS